MYDRRQINPWVMITAVIAILSLLMVFVQSENNIDVFYGETTSVLNETTSISVTLDFHENEKPGFRYGVPEDWTYVVQNGHKTYIHAPSGTSVQYRIQEYSPTLLQTNKISAAEKLAEQNMILKSLEWNTNTSFTMIYQKESTDKYIFVEMTTFDKEFAVTSVYTIQEEYYDRVMDTVIAMIDSFQWKKENPYPTDVTMMYNSIGNFEFAVISSWNVATQNNVLFAQDPVTQTLMSVTVNESSVTFENIKEIEYVNWAASGRSNYMLQSFQSDKSTIYALSTYSASNTKMVLLQYMYATGKFEYIMTFEIPQNVYADQSNAITALINLLKIYE